MCKKAELARYVEITEELKKLEAEKETLKEKIISDIGGKPCTWEKNGFVINYSETYQDRFDVSSFKQDDYDTYAEYLKSSLVRKLSIKEITK